MTEHDQHQRSDPRRETTTRRAFILWMAAYATALLIVATMHGFGGSPTGVAIDKDGVRTQQARAVGEPQSSLVERMLPDAVTLRTDG